MPRRGWVRDAVPSLNRWPLAVALVLLGLQCVLGQDTENTDSSGDTIDFGAAADPRDDTLNKLIYSMGDDYPYYCKCVPGEPAPTTEDEHYSTTPAPADGQSSESTTQEPDEEIESTSSPQTAFDPGDDTDVTPPDEAATTTVPTPAPSFDGNTYGVCKYDAATRCVMLPGEQGAASNLGRPHATIILGVSMLVLRA